MIRLLFIFIFTIVLLNASSDVDKKINKINTKLSSSSKSYSSLNKKMDQNAVAILKQKKVISKQQRDLKKLTKELSKIEYKYEQDTKDLNDLKVSQKTLKQTQIDIEDELVFTIAQSVSLSVILEEKYTVSEESLIEFEVLKSILKASKEKAKQLNDQFFNNSKKISALNKHVNALERSIANIDGKRKNLLSIQKKNKKSLSKLEKDKSIYKKELKKLLKRQDSLKKTLSKLNIVKIDKIKKEKEEKARAKAFKEKKKKERLDEKLIKVKKHGSSYQKAKTARYRGRKTIAPLDSYTITKKYGTYTDPIYGIKIFNESISLKPKKSNSKVKTVFNGKVIYADNTAVLNNIVIVQHTNGLHTIYANLSQISPNIKTGMRIKKGYTIGRVSDELIFEVTQKSFHINPVNLF